MHAWRAFNGCSARFVRLGSFCVGARFETHTHSIHWLKRPIIINVYICRFHMHANRPAQRESQERAWFSLAAAASFAPLRSQLECCPSVRRCVEPVVSHSPHPLYADQANGRYAWEGVHVYTSSWHPISFAIPKSIPIA